MEKVKMAAVLVILGLLLASAQGARDLPNNNNNNNNKQSGGGGGGGGGEVVEHPQNVYGAVGGVGGIVPGEGGGGNPVVVSGGSSFNCPFPGIALGCTFNVHPVVPGGGPGFSGGVPNP